MIVPHPTFDRASVTVVKTWANWDSEKHEVVCSFKTKAEADAEAARLNETRSMSSAYYVR